MLSDIKIETWQLQRLSQQEAQQRRVRGNAVVSSRLFLQWSHQILARAQRYYDIAENLIVWSISSDPETPPTHHCVNTDGQKSISFDKESLLSCSSTLKRREDRRTMKMSECHMKAIRR